jgi:hypothetical protein
MGADNSKTITGESRGAHEKRYLTRLAVEKRKRTNICFLLSFAALDLLTMVALIEFLGHYHQCKTTMPCGQHSAVCISSAGCSDPTSGSAIAVCRPRDMCPRNYGTGVGTRSEVVHGQQIKGC